MRYGGRVIATLIMIISALMVGGPARAGEMDNVLPLSCVTPWYGHKWAIVTLSCDEAAYDVLHFRDGRANRNAGLDGEAPGPGAPGIDFAYPAAFALARSAYAYYALGSYTKAEAQRQRAITLLSNADTSPKSSSLYEDGPKVLLAHLEDKAFFQNDDIINDGIIDGYQY